MPNDQAGMTWQERQRLGAKLGGMRAQNRPKDEINEVHAALVTEQLATFIAKVVADAPPLTAAQRDRLVALLRVDGT